jgi:hypothetical protein
VMNRPENQRCSDCNDMKPTWASLIVAPPGTDGAAMGAFCCFHCSGAHRRIGVHICFVRSVSLDECKLRIMYVSTKCAKCRWFFSNVFVCYIGKEKEVVTMEIGGNKRVNKAFEAKLGSLDAAVKPNSEESNLEARANKAFEAKLGSHDAAVKPNSESNLEARDKFIRAKYNERSYFDPKKYCPGPPVVKTLHSERNHLGYGDCEPPPSTGRTRMPRRGSMPAMSRQNTLDTFAGMENEDLFSDSNVNLFASSEERTIPLKSSEQPQTTSSEVKKASKPRSLSSKSPTSERRGSSTSGRKKKSSFEEQDCTREQLNSGSETKPTGRTRMPRRGSMPAMSRLNTSDTFAGMENEDFISDSTANVFAPSEETTIPLKSSEQPQKTSSEAKNASKPRSWSSKSPTSERRGSSTSGRKKKSSFEEQDCTTVQLNSGSETKAMGRTRMPRRGSMPAMSRLNTSDTFAGMENEDFISDSNANLIASSNNSKTSLDSKQMKADQCARDVSNVNRIKPRTTSRGHNNEQVFGETIIPSKSSEQPETTSSEAKKTPKRRSRSSKSPISGRRGSSTRGRKKKPSFEELMEKSDASLQNHDSNEFANPDGSKTKEPRRSGKKAESPTPASTNGGRGRSSKSTRPTPPSMNGDRQRHSFEENRQSRSQSPTDPPSSMRGGRRRTDAGPASEVRKPQSLKSLGNECTPRSSHRRSSMSSLDARSEHTPRQRKQHEPSKGSLEGGSEHSAKQPVHRPSRSSNPMSLDSRRGHSPKQPARHSSESSNPRSLDGGSEDSPKQPVQSLKSLGDDEEFAFLLGRRPSESQEQTSPEGSIQKTPGRRECRSSNPDALDTESEDTQMRKARSPSSNSLKRLGNERTPRSGHRHSSMSSLDARSEHTPREPRPRRVPSKRSMDGGSEHSRERPADRPSKSSNPMSLDSRSDHSPKEPVRRSSKSSNPRYLDGGSDNSPKQPARRPSKKSSNTPKASGNKNIPDKRNSNNGSLGNLMTLPANSAKFINAPDSLKSPFPIEDETVNTEATTSSESSIKSKKLRRMHCTTDAT